MIPVSLTPPGTTGTTTTGLQTPFVGSNTSIGNLLTGLANPNVFSSVGRVFADGTGNLYASPTAGLMTNILAGTYNINTSCSITMTLTDPFVTNSVTGTGTGTQTPGVNTTPGSPVALTGYVTGNGTELDMFGTNGAVVTFLKISQGGSCNNSSLNGNFTISGNGFFFPSAGNGQVVNNGTTLGQPNPVTPVAQTGACLNGQTGATTGAGQTGTCTGAFTSGVTGAFGTPFSVMARSVANGAGLLTTDFSGQQSPGQNVTGTYSISSDCTGTARLVDAAGIARNISFVLVNQAAQCSIGAGSQSNARQAIEFVFSDPGVVGSGLAQLQ